MHDMRSYGQSCAVAKALDLIGDRWTLLIVRELMIQDGCRYTDLRNGLPGIATNLLAERLQDMERNGLITSEAAPPPVATTLHRLTARGRELEPVIAALGRWGTPLLGGGGDNDAFRDHWAALPLRLYVRDRNPEEPGVRIGLLAGTEALILETAGDGSVRVRQGNVADSDARIAGPSHLILSLLMGKTKLDAAQAHGVRFEGNAEVLRRFEPRI